MDNPFHKECENCKKDFTIEPEDFNFYEKIKVPAPVFCPECRLIQRLASLDDRSLFKDKCDNCGKEIVSLFAPETSFVVFCSLCWWGDSWDGINYGMNYNFDNPFFQQHKEQKTTKEVSGANKLTI